MVMLFVVCYKIWQSYCLVVEPERCGGSTYEAAETILPTILARAADQVGMYSNTVFTIECMSLCRLESCVSELWKLWPPITEILFLSTWMTCRWWSQLLRYDRHKPRSCPYSVNNSVRRSRRYESVLNRRMFSYRRISVCYVHVGYIAQSIYTTEQKISLKMAFDRTSDFIETCERYTSQSAYKTLPSTTSHVCYTLEHSFAIPCIDICCNLLHLCSVDLTQYKRTSNLIWQLAIFPKKSVKRQDVCKRSHNVCSATTSIVPIWSIRCSGAAAQRF